MSPPADKSYNPDDTEPGRDGESLEPKKTIPAPLPPAVQEILNRVPEGERANIVKVALAFESYNGTFPHPDHAKAYEETSKGAFGRILAIREAEVAYSIERDREERQNNYRWEKWDQISAAVHSGLGMVLGFLVSIALIGGAVYLAVNGHQAVPLALIGATAAGMVAAFLNARRDKGARKEHYIDSEDSPTRRTVPAKSVTPPQSPSPKARPSRNDKIGKK